MAEPIGPISRLTKELTKLPGIGPKSADRLAHFLLAGDRSVATQLAEALYHAVSSVRACRKCGNYSEGELCPICLDPKRDPSLICVVETPRDIDAIERVGFFKGRYHVLGGRLAPLEGIGPDKLSYSSLVDRVHQEQIKEIILATSPTLEGDTTALFAANLLKGAGVTLSRLARGVPTGSSLELANTQMLLDALEGRQKFT
ncbi:MAG: recombination mediator RecR [Gemmataceae bacterium]|nr:recombination mediator RecR [Gemmataceae bacterium]